MIFTAAFSGLFLILILTSGVWLLARRVNKSSIIDIFWGALIAAAAAWYCFFLKAGTTGLWALLLVWVWALRLGLHIDRRARGHGEDPRYLSLRESWGAAEWQKMYVFYMKQAAGAFMFSWPFLILAASRVSFPVFTAAGTGIWLAALAGETASDAQLAAFKANPANRGKVCREGLWKYSRHPNYFFEWLNWAAYACLAWPHPGGWIALICPVLMYYFLNHVTGIPYAERQSLKSRPEEYARYQKTTSAFFPWFPRDL